jgi:hypothetical protein
MLIIPFCAQYSLNHRQASQFLCRASFPSVQLARLKCRAGATKGMKNEASNRDLLSSQTILSEISSALVARILDWSGGTCLSAYAGPTGIAALFRPQDICFTESTRRNNRCACVLTAPQLGTISAAKDSQPTALQLIVAGQQAPCQRAVKDLMIP